MNKCKKCNCKLKKYVLDKTRFSNWKTANLRQCINCKIIYTQEMIEVIVPEPITKELYIDYIKWKESEGRKKDVCDDLILKKLER